MKRLLCRGLGLAALIGVSITSSANAWGGTGTSGSGCGGSNFSTCASVTLTYSNNTATLTVTNWAQPADVFTNIGLTGLTAGNVSSYTAVATGVNLGNGLDTSLLFQQGAPQLSGDGIQRRVAGVSSIPGGNPNVGNIQNGLASGYSLQIVFTLTGPVDWSRVGVAIQGQGGPGGCSTKLVFNSSGGILDNANAENYATCNASTVPEPATIGLLTTGLLGMGGVGFLRRRKKA